MDDYYKVLGVKRTATGDELNKAYSEQALKCHHAKNANNTRADKRFKKASEAYQALSDPLRRSLYDKVVLPPPGAGRACRGGAKGAGDANSGGQPSKGGANGGGSGGKKGASGGACRYARTGYMKCVPLPHNSGEWKANEEDGGNDYVEDGDGGAGLYRDDGADYHIDGGETEEQGAAHPFDENHYDTDTGEDDFHQGLADDYLRNLVNEKYRDDDGWW